MSVRHSKANKGRPLPLPETCKGELHAQIEFVKQFQLKDQREKVNGVGLPYAFERKSPNARKSLAWQWAFHSLRIRANPRTLIIRRRHIHLTHLPN
jgi:hypothetical protein